MKARNQLYLFRLFHREENGNMREWMREVSFILHQSLRTIWCFQRCRPQELKLFLTDDKKKTKTSSQQTSSMGYLLVQCTLTNKMSDDKEQVRNELRLICLNGFYCSYVLMPLESCSVINERMEGCI